MCKCNCDLQIKFGQNASIDWLQSKPTSDQAALLKYAVRRARQLSAKRQNQMTENEHVMQMRLLETAWKRDSSKRKKVCD